MAPLQNCIISINKKHFKLPINNDNLLYKLLIFRIKKKTTSLIGIIIAIDHDC